MTQIIRRQRVEGWPEKLFEAVDSARNTPFEWGQHDCVLFAADLVQVVTGEDLVADFRGSYASVKEALKILKTSYQGDLSQAVTSKLGGEIDTTMAQRGDVVLVDTAEQPALGVVIDHRAAAPGPDGVVLFERACWLKAWAV